MLIKMLITFEEEALSPDRRAVTFMSFRAVELVVKINARPSTVCQRMDDVLSPFPLTLKRASIDKNVLSQAIVTADGGILTLT